jgi:hypothetical protein
VVTITPPLQHPQWRASQTPQAWIFQPIRYSGVENLSIDGTAPGASAPATIGLSNASYVWVNGVRIINGWQNGIFCSPCTRGQFEKNYIYNIGQNNRFPDAYGIRYNGSNFLIQNNIIQFTRTPVLAEGPSNGSVIAYNFGILDYAPSDSMIGSFYDHSAGDNYQLFEGNAAAGLFNEDIHGSHPMETAFRNFFTGWESCGSGQCGTQPAKDSSTQAIEALAYARYMNNVANVLGTPGYHTLYESTATLPHAVYLNGSGNVAPQDPVTGTTMLRWANYDVASGTVRFCGNSSNTGFSTTCANTSEIPTGAPAYPNAVPTLGDTGAGQGPLPASFYLLTKPAWFGSLPFPPIGPDVSGGNVGQCSGTINTPGQFSGVPATSNAQCGLTTLSAAWGGHVNAIPAMQCFLTVMGGVPDGFGAALPFDANTCYGSAGPPPQNPSVPVAVPH